MMSFPCLFPLALRGIPLTPETAPHALGGLAAVFLWWWAALLFLSLRAGWQATGYRHRLALFFLPPAALLSALAAFSLNQ